MSKIRIDSAKVTPCIQKMSELGTALESNSHQIDNVLSSVRRMQSVITEPTCVSLRGVSDAVLTRAAHMGSLAEALQVIADSYDATEKRLVSTDANGESQTRNKNGESDGSASWCQKIMDFLKRVFHWNESVEEPEGVTREEEKAHDLFMQEQIFALLETSEFSKKTWNRASVAERKSILESFLVKIAAVFGVTVSTSVNFYDGPQSERGYYSHSDRGVSINEKYLSRSDSYQIMQTMIHEMRHAYQHAAVDDPSSYQVSAETIKAWADNFPAKNYKSTSKGNTYEEYVSQPIEWDAKNFAKQYSDITNAKPEYVGSWGS